eukprot:TRINITY_DN10579_c0_g1_i1.p1 TRINITY_DN10579_c0_g1~~TRINITY_DN10579_c0_g1_i1.p1  ORF type:complete len:414 (+),score=47.95 TRINITY_DN10579_c0_g1_i1:62-1303(+)
MRCSTSTTHTLLRCILLDMVLTGCTMGVGNETNPPTGGSDDSDDQNFIKSCTGNEVCRLSVLIGVVLCVVAGLCIVIKGTMKREAFDDGTSSAPSELNNDNAHAVQHYQPHEVLWPGPNEWRRMSLHQRGKVTAKIVKQTTAILRGPDAPEHAKKLNNWVRSDDGIYRDDLEAIKASLDQLLCLIDTSQEVYSTDLGAPWPKHSRWRRVSNRFKAMVYASFMKDKLTNRQHIKKYARWVKERGYLINRVNEAASEAERTVYKILSEKPVAYSDARKNGGFLSRVAEEEEEDAEGDGAWLEEEAQKGRVEREKLEQKKLAIPELSITVASPVEGPVGGVGGNAHDDSLAVFTQYIGTSPHLSDEDVTPLLMSSTPPRRQSFPSTRDPGRLSSISSYGSEGFSGGLNDDYPGARE